MRILGIDPGIAIVGFGLIEAERGQTKLLNYGAITTPAGLPLARRLVQIEQDMEALIAQLKPDAIAIYAHAGQAGGRRVRPCRKKTGHGHGQAPLKAQGRAAS